MSHECPICYQVCCCNGDIDDVEFDNPDVIAACHHCNEYIGEDDDCEEEAEPAAERGGGGL